MGNWGSVMGQLHSRSSKGKYNVHVHVHIVSPNYADTTCVPVQSKL